MNTKRLIVSIAATLMVAFVSTTRASDMSSADDSPAIHKLTLHHLTLKKLTTDLGLSTDQREKIKPIIAKESAELKLLSENSSMNDDEKRSKADEIVKAARDQVRPLLTPDQQQKLDAIKIAQTKAKKKSA